MEGVPGLCLPADLPHPAHTAEESGGSSAGGANSTLAAEEELVPRTGRPTSGSPEDPAPSPGPDSAADIADSASLAERSAPDCVAIIRRTGTQAGPSDRAAALVASSRRVSTCESYNSRLVGFFLLHWCESHGVDPRSAPVHHIAVFLIDLFDKGRSISTIRGHRSAIVAIHSGFADGTCVSTAPCLSNLIRALFLKRPPVRKLLPSWSLPAVLEALTKAPFEPLAEASLRDLTIVFLVAIASGQRRSVLHALSSASGHIRWERSGVRLIPNPYYIAKNQTVSSHPVEIFYSTYLGPLLCIRG